MFTRQLGRSGITVSAVGFGCWPIGGLIIEDGKSDVRGAGHRWMWLFPDGQPNQAELGKLAAIRDILTSNGRTMAQGTLAWLWGRSKNTIPIPGFKGMQQAEENARAMEFGPLTFEQMAEIQHILERENS